MSVKVPSELKSLSNAAAPGEDRYP